MFSDQRCYRIIVLYTQEGEEEEEKIYWCSDVHCVARQSANSKQLLAIRKYSTSTIASRTKKFHRKGPKYKARTQTLLAETTVIRGRKPLTCRLLCLSGRSEICPRGFQQGNCRGRWSNPLFFDQWTTALLPEPRLPIVWVSTLAKPTEMLSCSIQWRWLRYRCACRGKSPTITGNPPDFLQKSTSP